jgi:flagellar biosynthetic protein FlhB
MVVFMGIIVCLHAVGGASIAKLQVYLKTSLIHLNDAGNTPLTANVLFAKAEQAGLLIFSVVGPVMMTALVLGILVNVLQTGFLVAPEALRPDFNRLNPLTGITRYFSARGLVETIKACAKIAIIAWIAWSTISGSYTHMLDMMKQDLPTILTVLGDLIYRLALRICGFLLVLAAADYAYQRVSFEKSIRMSKTEVKQESKQAEGSPIAKSRQRAQMRMMAKKRMMSDVPLADVIITNPTHFAVALKYDGMGMVAPRVVAKGADLIAARIREIAQENGVPIVENPPLARNLYKNVEVGQDIPPDLYSAVAEVLAYVFQINARKRGFAGTGR